MQSTPSDVEVPDVEIAVRRPDGAPLVRDYLQGQEPATSFFGGQFDDLERFRAKAQEIDGRFDRDARRLAADALTAPGGADPDRLHRWVEEGGLVVTTGQQPGLFGGPLYGIHKALTAVRLAEALESALGRPVLPVFWVASDDHDWAEANHVDIVDLDNELRHIELEAPDPGRSPPLHRICFDDSIEDRLDTFIRCLPESDFTAELKTLLRSAFREGGTLPEGYATLMRALLGRFGLYVTDAANGAVKRASGPILLEELSRSAASERVLTETASRLDAGGYDLQVPILEGDAGRERLYRENGEYRLRGSGAVVTEGDIRRRFEKDPRVLSPNVLLRPVVESAVFPALAYVGGPGEMAYFAQLGDYFESHGIGMPVVFPRWAATTVESKVRKVLDKFDLEISQLEQPFHELAGAIARDEMPHDVRAALGKMRGSVAKGVAELQSVTRPLDPTLKGPVQHVRSQTFAALDDLERKVTQAVKRESEIALSQLEKARVHLYPGGKPAERVHNVFYFLARYGVGFLDALHARFEVELR
jgi:bacillithiol biosynthesis cysteine-adding enzyme BshC